MLGGCIWVEVSIITFEKPGSVRRTRCPMTSAVTGWQAGDGTRSCSASMARPDSTPLDSADTRPSKASSSVEPESDEVD